MINAKNIHRKFGSLEVLKGLDFDIPEKEIVAITGASGAGKSTLLHILGSLDKPDQGSLSIAGIHPFSLSDKKLAAFRNRHIGFVFQFHHLLPEFSALENICIPAFIAGLDKKEAHNKAQVLAELLGITQRLDHRPAALSGGEQQRVAVCRALINAPSVVLADEPSGNLDSRNARELHALFLKLRKELGQTFVVVTHNQELAKLADRIIHLVDGRIGSDHTEAGDRTLGAPE
jgi:lipoprotein-releasing system ATP-binding protein